MSKVLYWIFVTALLVGVAVAQNPAESQGNAPGAQTTPPSVAPGESTQGAQGSPATPGTMGTGQAQSESTAQSASSNAAPAGRVAAGTVIPAELTKSLDAKKVKTGDQIVARTTQDLLSNGQIVIPRGAKIFGHVTQAQARSKGRQQSTLGIEFDRIAMKSGSELPMQASIQAIGPPLQSAAFSGNEPGPMDESAGMPSGPAGSMGGMGRPGAAGQAPGEPVPATHGQPNAGSPAPSGGNALSAGTQGVVGLKGLELNQAAANQGSLITSSSQNVHLDNGTQLILRTQ